MSATPRSESGSGVPGSDESGFGQGDPVEPEAASTAPGVTPVESDADEPDEGEPDEPSEKKSRPLSHELPVLLVIAVALALLLKAFVVQAFYIPSGSMERTLLIKDRVLVNKLVYRFRDVHRGEIVVFNGSGTGFTESESVIPPPTNGVQRAGRAVQRVIGLGAPGERDFVKRVIAVGGDTVACCDAQGRVTVNNVPLDEPYIFENNPLDGGRVFAPVKVPKDYLWVMGDHRGDSGDSRLEGHGPIPQNRVIGRAFVRVWPVTRFAFLRVPKTFSTTHAAGPVSFGVVGAPVLLFGSRRLRAGHRARRRRRSRSATRVRS